MKKYKLIKEYPGSPKLGEIWNGDTTIKGLINSKSQNKEFENNQKISNLPEFWEEIVEKDYKILSWINKSNGAIVTAEECLYTEKRMCNGTTHYIYSIKRLSDGEIFTIGDRIKLKNNEFSFDKLFKFDIYNTTLVINIENKTGEYPKLKSIEHYKKRLFTTEDGVDIFNGGTYYTVNYTDNFQLNKGSAIRTFEKNIFNYKYFSTKEKAEEYTFWNKPCLSLRDVFANTRIPSRKILIQRVQEKLKLKPQI